MCAFPAAQRHLLGQFLGFDEAAILQHKAWDIIVLEVLPRLLPREVVLVPRSRCKPSAPCPCNLGLCWCRLQCPCSTPGLAGGLSEWLALWRVIRQRASERQLYSLQIEEACLAVPASFHPQGVRSGSAECLRLLCRHSDPVTTAKSWARLGSLCKEEATRREQLRQRQWAIASRCTAIFSEGVVRSGCRDPVSLARSVQTGLLRSRQAWDERIDQLSRIIGASADTLEEADEYASRIEFRPVREKPPEPEWIRQLPCAPQTRKRLRRLCLGLQNCSPSGSRRNKELKQSLAISRRRVEEEHRRGWALRQRKARGALLDVERSIMEQEKTQRSIQKARLVQRGLAPTRAEEKGRAEGSQRKRLCRRESSENVSVQVVEENDQQREVEAMCLRGDWKGLFGEPADGESVHKTKSRYGQRLKQLVAQAPPHLVDPLVKVQREALTALRVSCSLLTSQN